MNLHDFDHLFEAYEGIVLSDDEDFDTVSEDVLQEASKLVIEPKDGEVWIAMMPYLNFKKGYGIGYKNRPVLFLKDETHGLVAIRCSKTRDKRPDQINKRHNLVFEKWMDYGFTEESYLVGTDARLLQNVGLQKKIGQISGEVLEKCREKFNLFKEERETAPELLMNYLLYVSIKKPLESYETLIMQNPKETIENERGNSVDISTLVYFVFSKYYIPFKIVSTELFNNEVATKNHFWCLFKHNGRIKSFRFESGEIANGELYSYNTGNIDNVVKYESDWLLNHFSKSTLANRVENYVLDDNDELKWMALVEDKARQIELIDYLNKKKPESATSESVTIEILPGNTVPGYPTRIFVKDLGDGSYCFDDTQLGVRMRTLNDKENGYTTDNLEANFASYIPTSTEVVDENIVEEAHKYIQKKLTYEEVKKNMTFIYDDDGIPNGVYEINGEKYRVRVETIVKREVNGTSCIFFEKKKEISHYGSMYKIPGGSVEPDKTLAEQAECEVNEEILCKVKNVNYTGKYYIVKYDPKTIPEWHKRILWPLGLKYVGAVTFVFTAEYDGPYRKKVAKVDQDSLAVKGDWYPVWEFEEIKADIHQGIALESVNVESVKESISTNRQKRVLLTSTGFDNRNVMKVFLDNIGKIPRDIRALFIPTAAMTKDDDKASLPNFRKDLTDAGILEYNINDYNFDSPMSYDEFMNYDCIYFAGGDEKYLINRINESGSRDNLIKAVNDGLFYIGVSAGACVASPYVNHSLMLCPNSVDVHYEEGANTNNGKLPKSNIQVNLSDKQAIFINGNESIIFESMEVVEETSIYTQKYKDFDEFCEYIQTPEEVATWYLKNHVKWPPGESGSDHPFRWPNDIIKHKIGNCYDHALFMHYFCNRKGITNKQIHTYVVLINRNDKTGEVYSSYCGHIVTLFEKNGQWYEFDPQPWRQKSGRVIEGPFDSVDEYIEYITECMELWGRKVNVGYETKCGTYVYSEDEQKIWDKFYNAPIKNRDEFTAKYLSKSDKTFDDYKKGKMDPVEQKQYFEYLRVRAAILMVIIRHGIKRVKNEVINFFNESADFDSFVNQLESLEVVEESLTKKNNVIPVDYSEYDGIDTRIICLNTHCLNGIEMMVPWVAGFALIGEPFLSTLIEFTAYTAYALADQIFAVDIFAVDKNINIRNDCEGLPIIAVNDGTVVECKNDVDNELGDLNKLIRKYGNFVVISHDNGKWFSVYAHLMKGSVTVKAGDKVHRGQKIAELGHSGNSDAKASHLHFEMLWTNVMAKTRPSLLLDLPKTLTGFGSYECTKIPWSTAAKIWIPFNKLEGLKQAYKEPMQPNNSGELSGACFLTDPPIKEVKEMLEVIEESAKQFKSSKAKNFNDFCNECKTPEDAMNWFIANKVVWNDKANDDYMRWPDTLVQERKGNCLDQSVMLHFFFKRKHIEHRLALFTIRLENGTTAGHIFPLFKRGKFIYAWLYIGPGNGIITGPYRSWYDAAGMVTEFYKVLLLASPKKGFDAPISDDTEWSVQEYSETKHFDKYLDKKIIQKDYLYGDGGDNLWSTHFFSRDFHFIRIPKVTGVMYKLIAWSKQYQTPKERKLAKEALELIKSGGMEPVQEEYKLSVYTKQYKTMDEFCKQFKTFDDLVLWFQANHIKWPDYKNTTEYDPLNWPGEIHWPEDLLRDKVGNCFDQALFAYYFCKKNKLPARMYRFSIFYDRHGGFERVKQCTSHFVTMVQRTSGIFIFSYQGMFNDTAGPYKSYEKAVEKYGHRFHMFFKMMLNAQHRQFALYVVSNDKDNRRDQLRSGYFTEDDMKFFDMTYGDKRLTQNEYVKKSKGCSFPEDGETVKHTLFSLGLHKLSQIIGVGGIKLSDYIASKEATEEPIDVKNVVPMGICDYVLQYLGNAIDIQKFADIKSGRRFMYTHCTVMKKHIPLILLLSYCEGLTTVLRKAEVNFFFTDTRPRLKEYDSILKGVVPFADGYLVYDKFPLEVSLLMNGLALVDTKGFEYAEMDGKDVYVSLFDILFGTRMLANAFDNFYDWMIDPVTYTVLQDLNYPTDFVGLLLAGNKLLADNSYTDELDMRNYRIRSNEMAYAYAFKRISEAYGKFRMTSNNKNPDKISIPQGSVIKDIMQSQMVEDVSELSPIVEVEKSHTISDKG